MDPLVAAAGLIAVGAAVPGPNNLVVMRIAAGRGLSGAAPAIAGIVLGGLAVLLLVGAGVESVLAELPVLRRTLGGAACAYLVWLGARMCVGASVGPGAQAERLPMSLFGLFAFQLVQPGPWILALAALSSWGVPEARATALTSLAALFAAIPAICLGLWSLAGVFASRRLGRRSSRDRFDRALGALFVGFAISLFLRLLETT